MCQPVKAAQLTAVFIKTAHLLVFTSLLTCLGSYKIAKQYRKGLEIAATTYPRTQGFGTRLFFNRLPLCTIKLSLYSHTSVLCSLATLYDRTVTALSLVFCVALPLYMIELSLHSHT